MTENYPSTPHTLSEENELPLYLQLLALLKHQINTGLLKPGDLIPSEAQLCAQHNLSRTTVRLALNRLTEENLIIRRRGKGSFVANRKLHRSLNHLYSFSEDMLAIGLDPSSRVIEKSVVTASPDEATALNLPTDELRILRLVRLRLANQEPLLFETARLPLYLCRGIEHEDFTGQSLYQILKSKYRFSLHRAVETYEAIRMPKEAAALLNTRPGDPSFQIRRIAQLQDGTAFELTDSIARGDKCVFKVELQAEKNRVSFSRQITL